MIMLAGDWTVASKGDLGGTPEEATKQFGEDFLPTNCLPAELDPNQASPTATM